MKRYRNRILITFLCGIATSWIVSGQGDTIRISLAYPVHSQYLHNGLVINPAYAGSREALSLFISGRKQWLGIKGSPVYESISMHSLLKNNTVGLGLSAQLLQYGFSRSTRIYGNYSYHLTFGKSRLAMGIRGGVDISDTDYSNLTLITSPDPAFTGDEKPYYLPNVGAGLYFYNRTFFVGAAVPSILSYVKNDSGKAAFDSFTRFNIQATAGFLLSFSEGFRLKPSVFIDYPLNKEGRTRIDINGNVIIKDFLWVGGSWRTSEEVAVGILQIQVNPQLMLGFSYDYSLGNLKNYSDGSVEVILRYEFGYKVSAANPRYF